MKQISFFTRGTMAALTKEEGGSLSRSASSHPTSVPRINPFHLRLCGDTAPELPNKGGRKAPPCPGLGGDGQCARVPRLAVPAWLSLSLSHRDRLPQVLPAGLAARSEEGEICVPSAPLPRGPRRSFTQGALDASAPWDEHLAPCEHPSAPGS